MSKDYSWPADAELFEHGSVPSKAPSSMWKSSYIGSQYDMPNITTKKLVKEHSEKVNAWIVIDGITWDVAGFLDRHPGGWEAISKGIGKDATKLFKKVHPKVYPGDHIGVVFVGIHMPQDSAAVPLKKPSKFTCCAVPPPVKCLGASKKHAKSFFSISFYETDDFIILDISDSSFKSMQFGDWNWILTLHEKKHFAVTIFLQPGFCRRAEFTLESQVGTEFLYLKFYDSYRRVTVLFKKFMPGVPWYIFGEPTSDKNGKIVPCKDVNDETRVHIFYRRQMTASTQMVGLKIRPSTFMKIPPAYWIPLTVQNYDKEVFYPVAYSLLDDVDPSLESSIPGEAFYLLVRKLPQLSGISGILCSQATDTLEIDSTQPYMTIGIPSSSFDVHFLKDLDVLMLFARDLGIAPIISIIALYKEKDRKKGPQKEHVFLFYCNNTPTDFIWLHEWSELSEIYDWFHPFLVVNKPDSNWKELEGNISVGLIKASFHSIPGTHVGQRIKAIGSGDESFLNECVRVFEGMPDYFDDTCTIGEITAIGNDQ